MKSIICKSYHYVVSCISLCVYIFLFIKTNTVNDDLLFMLIQTTITFFLFFFLFEHGIGGRYKVITYHKFSKLKLFLGCLLLIILVFLTLKEEVKSIFSIIALSLSLAGEYGIIENSKSSTYGN